MDASTPEAHHLSLKNRLRIARLRRTIANRPVLFVAAYSIGIVFFCGLIYSLIETKTSIPDGLYWAIVTASTDPWMHSSSADDSLPVPSVLYVSNSKRANSATP